MGVWGGAQHEAVVHKCLPRHTQMLIKASWKSQGLRRLPASSPARPGRYAEFAQAEPAEPRSPRREDMTHVQSLASP